MIICSKTHAHSANSCIINYAGNRGSEGTVTGAKGAPDTSLRHPEAPQDVRSLGESGQNRRAAHWGQEGRRGVRENRLGNNVNTSLLAN